MFSRLCRIFATVLVVLCCLINVQAEFGQGNNVKKLANINTNGRPYSDVYYHNGLGFIGAYDTGFVYIFDVRDENNIKQIGTYRTSRSDVGILDLQARGDYLYCALSKAGFTIVDISNPANPKEIAFYDVNLPRGVHDLFVTDDYIYLCDNDFSNSKLHIVDITDKKNPSFVTTYKSNGGTHDLTVVGNIAYIANLRGGFRIADFSNPAKPVTLADHNYANSFTHNIWPSEDGKYVFTTDETCGTGRLRAFDISDLKNIVQVGEYRAAADAVVHNVMVVGNYAYIAYYKQGLRIVEISDPSKMVEVASFDTWDGFMLGSGCFQGAWGIYAEPNGRVYLSDIGSGFWAFQFTPTKDEPPVAELLSPRGGEVFGQGQLISIEWTSRDDRGIKEQSLELSLDGGTTYTPIVSQLSGTVQSFQFQLPVVATSDGKIRLTVSDGKNAPVISESQTLFAVVPDAPPIVRVISPNGGEVFLPGARIPLQWQTSDDRGLISQTIELSLDGGNNFAVVAQLDGLAQQFSLQLPTTLTTQALVRISVNDGVNGAITDTSDANFRISDDLSPTVRLITPIGNEQYLFNSQITVNWQSSDDRGLVTQKVEMSLDSGANFFELARVNGSVQSAIVKLPNIPSLVCRMRITVDDGVNTPVSSTSADFGLFELLPRITNVSLKTSNPDRLVIDLDPSTIHDHGRGIEPKHEGEEEIQPFLEIDNGSGFVPYLEAGNFTREGTRFTSKGKLSNGRSTREAIPNGVRVVIRYTDDHGAKALINVIRKGNSFTIVQ